MSFKGNSGDWQWPLLDGYKDLGLMIVQGCILAPCSTAKILAFAEDRDCTTMDGIQACCCGGLCAVRARSLLRKKFNIAQDAEGVNCIDFAAAGQYTCCAIVQEIKEIEHRTGQPFGMKK